MLLHVACMTNTGVVGYTEFLLLLVSLACQDLLHAHFYVLLCITEAQHRLSHVWLLLDKSINESISLLTTRLLNTGSADVERAPSIIQSAAWICCRQTDVIDSLYINYKWQNQITCQPEAICQMWTWLQPASSLFHRNEVEHFADGILDNQHSCETLQKLNWLINFLSLLAEADKRWNQNKNSHKQ